MKGKFLLSLLVSVVLLNTPTAWAASDFYVIAGGGAAVGTKITSVPYTITQPGFYYLGGNLTFDGGGSAITINADNVTLDLMGFSLNYNLPYNVAGVGMDGRSNVEIRNGSIIGFADGIQEVGAGANLHRIINIRTSGNILDGISLSGKNHLVKGCTACNNGFDGISVDNGSVSDCTACSNENRGIQVTSGTVIRCTASSNHRGILFAGPGSVNGNVANDNNLDGFSLGTGNIVVDRNSASGNGTNYSGGPANAAYWGINAGR